jgi:ATP-dependent Clp protease ATP-binding subunit ClpX
MVAGAGVYICNECVALCVELIETKPQTKLEATPRTTPAPPTWQERLSDDDLLAMLPKVEAIGSQASGQLAIAVRTARGRGITWTRIGAALGMTRQSAWERFSGEE